MTDILRQLRPASWRGISFPVSAREFGFQHEQERHRYIFRDDQLIESLGRENPTYRYTSPFREDIARGPYVNLFTAVYPKFLKACIDRTEGPLEDPIHGPVQVKCASLREILDVGKKDGIDVEIEFIVSPDEIPKPEDIASRLSTLEGAKGLGGLLDRQATELDEETKKAIADLNKGSGFGRLDPLSFATSALNQIEVAGNKVDAAFGDVAFRMERLDESLARVKNPRTQPMRQNARRLALAARDLQKTALGDNTARSKRVAIYQVVSPIGKIALAGKLGMNVRDFLRMNPSIASAPIVQPGTQVAYVAR